MKQSRFLVLLFGIFLFGNARVHAQMTGDCVFLQGRYVEVGIAPNGGFGSTLPAPATYHSLLTGAITFWDPAAGSATSSSNFLGFVADVGRDGWTVGTPAYFGDYYLPGSPQEGWAIQVGATVSTAYIPSYQSSTAVSGFTGTLSGTNTSYNTVGGISTGVWTGAAGTLAIRQTTVLDTSKLYFTVNVVLKNTGATALNNIYYVRTVDPDNEETRAGVSGFTTVNSITYQLPNPGNKVLVSAVGNTAGYSPNAYLGLGTKDCRAKCMYFNVGLAPAYNLSTMWAGSTPYTYAVGSSATDDVGIALDYNIGTINPGDSTSLTYAYILNATYIDSALNATQPPFLVNSFTFNSGDTINLCTYNFDTVLVAMGAGGFYHWHWGPDSLIQDTAGVSNVIHTSSITSPITYTITGVNVSGACDTVTYYLTLSHDVYNVTLFNIDTLICLGDSVQARVAGPPLVHYQWTPSTGVSNDTIPNPMFHPTVTTTYTLTTTSDPSCSPVVNRFTINVNNPRITGIVHANPTVCGYSDGSITLYGLVPGFFDTLHYTKNGVPQPPMPVGVSTSGTVLITGLSAGVYSNIYIKVGLCNTNIVGPDTLVNPAPPTVSVDSHIVNTCVGNPVQLHSYPSVTGIPIYYSWTPPAFLSSSTIAHPVVTPGVAGDITYTITINPGTNPACASSDTVHVHALAPIVLNNNDTIICLSRYVQGSITGSSEYAYQWSPSIGVSSVTLQNPVFTPTNSATYHVIASYADCPDQHDSFAIEVDTMAHPINIVDTICLGMSDTFDVRVPGPGTGSNYYHYQWIPAADVSNDTIPNPVVTPITMGTHTYSVVVNPRALNCSVTDIINIFVLPNQISITPHDTAICKGKVVQAVGAGDPLFTYQWLPTAGIGVSNVLNATITPDTSATYIVTARFGRCPDMKDSMHLWVQPNPTVYIGGNRLYCEFDTIHINAMVTPTWYDSFSYSWTPATGLDFTTTQTVVYSGNTTTDIYLTVSTPAGCIAKDSAHITIYPGNFASISPLSLNFCPHDTAALPMTSTVPGVRYHWYPSKYLSDSLSGAPVIRPVSTQVYTIVATTVNGCKDTVNFTATVSPAALISLPDSITIVPGESYNFNPLTNCNSFVWMPPVGLSNPYISNPTLMPSANTRYFVYGTTIDGCKTADSVDVYLNNESAINLPNAFTPGKANNYEFKVMLDGVASLNYFKIYNRWGNLMFETNSISKGWDGSYNGEPQPFGVYVYEVEAVTTNGTIVRRKGNVTLLR